jgi:hypothetical protein
VKIYSKETIGRTVGRFCCNRQFLKIWGWENDRNVIRSASCNNRSLALRKIFGLSKSEWEHLTRIVPIRVLYWLKIFSEPYEIWLPHKEKISVN